MRVVVTGGAGFIGSATAEVLLMKGYEVLIYDNLYSGSKENIPHGAELVIGDIRNFDKLMEALRGAWGVVHLAAIVSIEEALQDPWKAARVNVEGTLNVLEACRKLEIERLVYASSCAVYGDPITLPVNEEHPLKPKNVYGASKLSGEALVNAYAETYGLKSISLRYFNVYGPRMHGGPYAGVIHKFITAALEGEPLVIYGDGMQTRDFIYVYDVARANVAALKSRATGQFNIGTGRSVTIKELAHMILELTKSSSPVRHGPTRPGDIRHSRADITRAVNELKWEPKVKLEEGLADTISYYRSRYSRHK